MQRYPFRLDFYVMQHGHSVRDRLQVRRRVYAKKKMASIGSHNLLISLIGAEGFEPPTSRSQTERSTKLSHAPLWRRHYTLLFSQFKEPLFTRPTDWKKIAYQLRL
jgi:hypothetical protein